MLIMRAAGRLRRILEDDLKGMAPVLKNNPYGGGVGVVRGG